MCVCVCARAHVSKLSNNAVEKAIELTFFCSFTLAQSVAIVGSWVPSQGVDYHVKSHNGDSSRTSNFDTYDSHSHATRDG